MQRLRRTSICLFTLTSVLGILRGLRLTAYSGTGYMIYPYPKETIKATIFSNYEILGWIIFSLVGIFSIVVVMTIVKRVRNYGYFIIVEGIFLTFLTTIHILITGFAPGHFLLIPVCFAAIILGILQVPKEF